MERCVLCNKERNDLGRLYWRFFKVEYEPDKWIIVCPDCCRKFQRASFGYAYDRTPLIEMERKIIKNKKKLRRR